MRLLHQIINTPNKIVPQHGRPGCPVEFGNMTASQVGLFLRKNITVESDVELRRYLQASKRASAAAVMVDSEDEEVEERMKDLLEKNLVEFLDRRNCAVTMKSNFISTFSVGSSAWRVCLDSLLR